MNFLELLEQMRAEEASEQRLFGGEGTGVRQGQASARYQQRLAEALDLVTAVYRGKRPAYVLREAMTTSDFPYLFGDILDRQLLAAYREFPVSYRNYCRVATVRDFRTVKRYSVYGADQRLTQMVGQAQEYPESKIDENTPFSYSVNKYGRKIPLSWETLINDDLGALRDIPERLGRAARRSEEWFATNLFVDASGPHASFYTNGNKNLVNTTNGAASNNPALSVVALQNAMQVLVRQTDENGEPIMIDVVELVIPPALEITAQNILNATQLWLQQNLAAGNAEQNLVTGNWMSGRVRINVNAYIPLIATTANANTSWFLFANPSNNRPAMEIGFLSGHEAPEIFMKDPNAMRVSGGVDMRSGDFDTDSVQYKIRHIFGGTRMDPKMTVASNGSGS